MHIIQRKGQRTMSQNSFSIQPFEAKRVQCESTRSYDEVLQNFQQLVDTTDHSAVVQGFSESVRTREDYEKVQVISSFYI